MLTGFENHTETELTCFLKIKIVFETAGPIFLQTPLFSCKKGLDSLLRRK